MARRTRRPETVRLEISQGDWLLVKKHLTAGESRRMYGRMLKGIDKDGQPTLDAIEVGPAHCLAYLVDWSDTITDADGKPIVIRDQPDEVILAALDALDEDSGKEITQAIERHMKAIEKEVAAETARPTSEIASSAISPSAA